MCCTTVVGLPHNRTVRSTDLTACPVQHTSELCFLYFKIQKQEQIEGATDVAVRSCWANDRQGRFLEYFRNKTEQ